MSRAAAVGANASSANTSSSSSSARASATRPARTSGGGYLKLAQRPFHCLIFLLPLLVCYEVGTTYFASDPAQRTEHRIIAFSILRGFLELFGASGRYLPAMAVVGVLLAWHIARNDSWQIRWGVLTGMFVESVVFTLFLIAISVMMVRYVPLMGLDGAGRPAMLVLCLGAGVYEELIFRLVAFTLLNLLLLDLLKVPKVAAALLIVLTAAVLFAGYHYLGNEPFRLQTFVFRTVAGIYFGILFIFRGFGITAATHALYDVMIVWLQARV